MTNPPMNNPQWKLFLGNGRSQPLKKMPDAPVWRTFMTDDDFKQEAAASQTRWQTIQALADKDPRGKERGESFRLEDKDFDVINAVNAALHLRRPLLLTGKPGSGKTSLAYAVAQELKLGVVLTWPVNARSTLQDALYRYDAVARLQDAQLKKLKPMGDYIRLGPLGTAFLPSHLPRVLLIDEVDKCDLNLPNDLLNLFEEGWYEIPELVRRQEEGPVTVKTADQNGSVEIRNGRVFCREFPFVVMTSNGERDFPPAFLRRCLRLRMPDSTGNQKALERIVEAHLNQGKDQERWQQLQEEVRVLVENFVNQAKAESPGEAKDVATDQLLNAVYLLTREVKPDRQKEREQLLQLLLKGLSEEN